MDRFSNSIVWTPLPIISYILPFIGHTGIADDDGIIYDFGASNYIAIDNFTFGQPTKYLRLDKNKVRGHDWNQALEISASRFRQKKHDLIFNNCHDHVADVLNEMKYNGRDNYNKFDIFMMMTFKSSYVDVRGFLFQWGPFMIILTIITLIISLATTAMD